MKDLMVFTVTVEQLAVGVSVRVDAGDAGEARVTGPTTRVALEMAVPFMRDVAEQDDLADVFRLPPGFDGPRDQG